MNFSEKFRFPDRFLVDMEIFNTEQKNNKIEKYLNSGFWAEVKSIEIWQNKADIPS